MTSAFGINILCLILSKVSNQLFKELELAHLILGQMVTCIYRSKKMHRKQYLAVPLCKTGEQKEIQGERVAFSTAASFQPFRTQLNAALNYFISTNQSPHPLGSETNLQYHLSGQIILAASAHIRNKILVSLTLIRFSLDTSQD